MQSAGYSKSLSTAAESAPIRTQRVSAKTERESVSKEKIRNALVKTGRALVWVHDVDNRQSKTGLGLGVADLILCVAPHGRFLGIEVKRPGRKEGTSSPQKCWLAVVRRFGGVTGVATNVAEAMALLEEASRERQVRD